MNRRELILELEGSAVNFGVVCLKSLFYLPPALFHYEVDALIHNPAYRYINIRAPRGHAKSAVISQADVMETVLSSAVLHNRKEYVLLISRTRATSDELLETIKNELTYNPRIRALYGDWGERTAKVWTKDRIVLKNDSVIQSRGTGMQIIGLRHHDLRPTLIVADDPEDENNTKTAEAMRANLRWLLGAVLPAIDSKRGRVIVVGTPKHELCMVEKLSKIEGWETRSYDSIIDEKGKVTLWPEQYDYDTLMAKMRSMRSANELALFYREWRCQIVGDEEQLFKPEYLRYYKGHLVWDNNEAYLHVTHRGKDDDTIRELLEPEIRPVNIFMGVDPASSTNERADWSVVMPVAVDREGNWFVLPYYRKQATPMHVAAAIDRTGDIYHLPYTSIETTGYQEMLRGYLREIGCMLPGLNRKNQPRTPKSKRLERMEPQFAMHKVFLQPDMVDLRNELLLYPRGAHDDTLDALDYATKYIYLPDHVAQTGPKPYVSKKHRSRQVVTWMGAT